jgi:glucokinase
MKVLAVDIGGSKLLTAIAEISEGLQESQLQGGQLRIGKVSHRPLYASSTKEQIISSIIDAAAELETADFERIGITIPGLASPAEGLWVYAPFSGIRDFPIASVLSEHFGNRKAFANNDVNACAWAEKCFGKCRDLDDFLWMTVSNGIGGGLVLNGKVFAGHNYGAAEIGHFGIANDEVLLTDSGSPFRCGCGNSGCLEAEAAGPGIVRRYLHILKSGGIHLTDNGDNYSAKQIAALAGAGDETAKTVIEITGKIIGRAASYAVNLLNLQAVIFGGGVMESFELFQPLIEKEFRKHLFRSANPSVILEKTAFGYEAGLAGAAAVSWNVLS